MTNAERVFQIEEELKKANDNIPESVERYGDYFYRLTIAILKKYKLEER